MSAATREAARQELARMQEASEREDARARRLARETRQDVGFTF